MDNTAAPVICRPLDHGAAVVMHSTTKYIGGHGTSIGGIVVDGGNFDWEKHADRFPLLNQPDPSYHGAVWTQAVKPLGPDRLHPEDAGDLAARPRRAAEPVQLVPVHPGAGDAAAADARALRQCADGGQVLSGHAKVAKVIHPSLMTGEAKRRADAYLKGGYGALRRFRAQGRAWRPAAALSTRCKMFYHVANIGDARSLAIHPASTTHSQLTPEEQLQTGVTDGYVRLSIGLEHEDDIIADLSQALDAAWRGRATASSRQSVAWPVDLGLTVASHGWVHLAPWEWEPATGTLSHAERIGGRIGRVSARQIAPAALAVDLAGPSRLAGARDHAAGRALGLRRTGTRPGHRRARRRLRRGGGADRPRRRPPPALLDVLRGFRQDHR